MRLTRQPRVRIATVMSPFGLQLNIFVPCARVVFVRDCSRYFKVICEWLTERVRGGSVMRIRRHLVESILVMLLSTCTAHAQQTTATITGRASDTSGGLLPGVTVAITSPAMIGGERTTVTDGQGNYQFTLLPPGEYRVALTLSGFATLTIERVAVTPSATMTVNGRLEVAGLEASVTVVSQTPAIDVKATTIATNWDQEKLQDLPYARGIRGLAMLVPGLTSTQFDVGGNTVGGSTTTGANSYGRAGDELARYEGAVWDQHFGDYD